MTARALALSDLRPGMFVFIGDRHKPADRPCVWEILAAQGEARDFYLTVRMRWETLKDGVGQPTVRHIGPDHTIVVLAPDMLRSLGLPTPAFEPPPASETSERTQSSPPENPPSADVVPTSEYEYDVVSGPVGDPVNVAPKPLSSPITGLGRYRTRDGNVVTIVERNDSVTDIWHEWYGRIATESHDRLLKDRTWHSDGWFGFVGSPYSWDLVERLPDPLPEPVRTFPSWLHPRFRYVARDENGRWFAYESKPIRENSLTEWRPGPDMGCLRLVESDLAPEALPSIVPDVDWKNSLISREPS